MIDYIGRYMGFEKHEVDYTVLTDSINVNPTDYTMFKYKGSYYFVFCVLPDALICRKGDSILKTALDDVDIVSIKHHGFVITAEDVDNEIVGPEPTGHGFVIDAKNDKRYDIHIHPRTYDMYRMMKFFADHKVPYETGITLYEYYMNNFYCGRYGKPHFSYNSDDLYVYCWNEDLVDKILEQYPDVKQINLYPFIEKRSEILYLR